MYAGSRPKSCDNKARYIPAQNSIQPLESALRTKSALGQADDAIKRSLASKDVGAAFFDDDGDVGALEPPDDAGRRGAAVFDDDDDEA